MEVERQSNKKVTLKSLIEVLGITAGGSSEERLCHLSTLSQVLQSSVAPDAQALSLLPFLMKQVKEGDRFSRYLSCKCLAALLRTSSPRVQAAVCDQVTGLLSTCSSAATVDLLTTLTLARPDPSLASESMLGKMASCVTVLLSTSTEHVLQHAVLRLCCRLAKCQPFSSISRVVCREMLPQVCDATRPLYLRLEVCSFLCHALGHDASAEPGLAVDVLRLLFVEGRLFRVTPGSSAAANFMAAPLSDCHHVCQPYTHPQESRQEIEALGRLVHLCLLGLLRLATSPSIAQELGMTANQVLKSLDNYLQFLERYEENEVGEQGGGARGVADRVVAACSDNDATLISACLCLHRIALTTGGAAVKAHEVFASLVSATCGDPSVLLDWLTAPETNFLPYFLLYLKLVVSDWSDFIRPHLLGLGLRHSNMTSKGSVGFSQPPVELSKPHLGLAQANLIASQPNLTRSQPRIGSDVSWSEGPPIMKPQGVAIQSPPSTTRARMNTQCSAADSAATRSATVRMTDSSLMIRTEGVAVVNTQSTATGGASLACTQSANRKMGDITHGSGTQGTVVLTQQLSGLSMLSIYSNSDTDSDEDSSPCPGEAQTVRDCHTDTSTYVEHSTHGESMEQDSLCGTVKRESDTYECKTDFLCKQSERCYEARKTVGETTPPNAAVGQGASNQSLLCYNVRGTAQTHNDGEVNGNVKQRSQHAIGTISGVVDDSEQKAFSTLAFACEGDDGGAGSPYDSDCSARTIICLLKVRDRLMKLQVKGLQPFNVRPLLRLLDKIDDSWKRTIVVQT